MRKRYLFPGLVLIGLMLVGVFGCDTNQEGSGLATALHSANTQAVRYLVDKTGATFKAVVSIGTITVIAVCDYAWDFMGPIPDGHDREPAPSYPRDYVSGTLRVGDVWAADNDGVVLHKIRSVGDPTGEDK